MNNLVKLLESFEEDVVLRIKFSDGKEFEYRRFEAVDESIYQDDSYIVGELQRPGKEGDLVEFQVHDIVQVKNIKTNSIAYERASS